MFQRKMHLVCTRLLQLVADLRPGFGAFRRPSQMQQCARLLNRCGKGPPDPRNCIHMTAYLQQHSTFCTGTCPIWSLTASASDLACWLNLRRTCESAETASDVSNRNDSWQKSSPKRLDPTSACLQKSCRHSGIRSRTCTLATVLSSLIATTRRGGHVISAQTAFLTPGRLASMIDHQGAAVLSAQACQHVSITRWPERHHRLHSFGMPRTTHCHQTK
jgi:hypothetical protein